MTHSRRTAKTMRKRAASTLVPAALAFAAGTITAGTASAAPAPGLDAPARAMEAAARRPGCPVARRGSGERASERLPISAGASGTSREVICRLAAAAELSIRNYPAIF